jgi:flagellar hook assembly protein FlgD
LEIYDATGRRIRVLRDSPMPHGWHEVSFEGRDDDGRQVPSGIYFCRLSTSGFEITRRMVLMR